MTVAIDGLIYSLQSRGGIRRYVDALLRGYLERDISCELLLHARNYPLPSWLSSVRKHVLHARFPLPFQSRTLRYICYPFDRRAADRYYASSRTGVLHSSYYTWYPHVTVPQIITVHDLTHEKIPELSRGFGRMYLRQKRRAILQAQALICTSNSTAQDLEKYYPVDGKKIFIVPLGVDTSLFESVEHSAPPSDRPYVLFVGKRGGYKNFMGFLRAYAIWSRTEPTCLVALGGGQLTKEEKRIIETLHLSDRVLVIPYADDDTLSVSYHGASAFVFPSLAEGFGLPLLEAMAAGCPVIASDISVFRELGQDVPVYIDPTSAESIIGALGRIERMRENNRREKGKMIARMFDWNTTVDQTLAVYTHVSKKCQMEKM